MSKVLMNTVILGTGAIYAGTVISDPTQQSAVMSAGGVLGDTNNPGIASAAALVQAMRAESRGTPQMWDAAMLAGMTGGAPFTPGTYTAGSTTPNVAALKSLEIANSSATSITNLLGGVDGQEVTLIFADAHTTLSHADGNFLLAGGVDFVSTAGEVLCLHYSGSRGKWMEVSRSADS